MNLPKEITTVTPLSKLVAIMLFFALPILGFYIGMHYRQPVIVSYPQTNYQQNTIHPTPTVTSEVPLSTNTQQITNDTDDWIMKKAGVCNVTIPVPPRKTPYVVMNTDGGIRFSWQFGESTQRGFGLFDMKFENIAEVEFNLDKEAQDSRVFFREGYVGVNCSRNTKHHTTESFAQEVADMLSKMVDSSKAEGIEGIISSVTQQKQQIWQRDVVAIFFEYKRPTTDMVPVEDTYYVFADRDRVYLIMKASRSTDIFVQNTTNRIFNTLQFASSQ